jgi:hypothetical protein
MFFSRIVRGHCMPSVKAPLDSPMGKDESNSLRDRESIAVRWNNRRLSARQSTENMALS